MFQQARQLLIAGVLAVATAAASPYLVTIDTTGLSGDSGLIDIQFNPGDIPPYDPATATITGFTITGGTLGVVDSGPFGGAIGGGSLPGPLAISNSDFLNGIVYQGLLGSQVSFLVNFTGAGFTNLGQTVLTSLSVDVSSTHGNATAVATLLGGSAIDTALSSQGVTFQDQAAVPEPSVFALVGVGLVALAFLKRARVKSAR